MEDGLLTAIRIQMEHFGDPVTYAIACGWFLDAAPDADVLAEYAKHFKPGVTIKLIDSPEDQETLRTIVAIGFAQAYPLAAAGMN